MLLRSLLVSNRFNRLMGAELWNVTQTGHLGRLGYMGHVSPIPQKLRLWEPGFRLRAHSGLGFRVCLLGNRCFGLLMGLVGDSKQV